MERKFANPYVAGIGLGLVLLFSFLVMGKGLGASGAAFRGGVVALDAVAHEHVVSNAHLGAPLKNGANPLDNFIVFVVGGVFLGGFVSSYAAGRMGRGRVVKGPRISISSRLALALIGGTLMGFAARMTRGCTSGQALSGGALMSAGSWIFMLSVFAGGYAMAWFVRRQWT